MRNSEVGCGRQSAHSSRVHPISSYTLHRQLRYQFVSNAYARMLGLRPQIIGKRIVEIIGENAIKIILPYIRRVLQGHREDYEAEINYKSVGTRRVRAIYTPQRDNHGRIRGGSDR
jgi:hypothetical protein